MVNFNKIWRILGFFGFLAITIIPFHAVAAADATSSVATTVEATSSNIFADQTLTVSRINKGAALSFFDGNFQLIVPASAAPKKGTAAKAATADAAVEAGRINEDLATPWNLNKLSGFYQFEIKPALDKEFTIRLNYSEPAANKEFKQIFYWDKNFQTWRPLDSVDHPEKQYVEAKTNLSYARVAVFSYPHIITTGRASWYAFKGGDFAASPDFPAGSRIRVFNTDNNKFVDVTINDYGPNRLLYPTRVIDLDKKAFKKIASTAAGLINVKIQPLEIKGTTFARALGISVNGAPIVPNISAESALVISEKTGQVLFSKNPDRVQPLASLTKLVAVKTFLDINDNRSRLSEVVAYSAADEKNNLKYCSASESAKLKVKDGEKLTIKDLIYASLVGSANNTIESLVRVSGLTRDQFIAQMNENVKDWGASSTSFVEPTGLSPQNVTSANDYAIIAKVAASDPIIQAASVTLSYSIKIPDVKTPHVVHNTDQLLGLYRYPITLSKTGYLEEAGYCLMTRVKANDDSLIIITFNTKDRSSSFSETEQLLRYGLNQLRQAQYAAASFKQ